MSRDSALRGFLLGLVFAAIAIPILECDGLGAASSQRLQQRGSSRASPRSRLAEKDEVNTAVSRQRARLGAKNSTVIGSIIKKPAAKTVKWAKDVVGRAVQRTSKMCCQLPRHFFNKTAMRALLDVSDDSEDDDQKKSLHDSELENPWLSDLDLETDPTLLNGREERFLDGQDHHHGHRHRRKGG